MNTSKLAAALATAFVAGCAGASNNSTSTSAPTFEELEASHSAVIVATGPDFVFGPTPPTSIPSGSVNYEGSVAFTTDDPDFAGYGQLALQADFAANTTTTSIQNITSNVDGPIGGTISGIGVISYDGFLDLTFFETDLAGDLQISGEQGEFDGFASGVFNGDTGSTVQFAGNGVFSSDPSGDPVSIDIGGVATQN